MSIQNIVFSPQESAKLAVQSLEELKTNKGVGMKSGILDLDKTMLPLRPPELITVLGYTSHYKSGFMNWLLKASLNQLEEDEIVVKITWEDSVEEETIKWIASDARIPVTTLVRGEVQDWNVVMHSYRKRISTPLWIVGHSNLLSADRSESRPRMTMTDVDKALEFAVNDATTRRLKPKLIVLDYLQRIRPDPQDGGTKREQMMEAVNRSKDLAVSFGVPVVLGVQAGRGVLTRPFKLPRLDDGLETSNIEQSSDKVISLWYPIKTENEGVEIESLGLKVHRNILIIGLLKQKLGEAPVVVPVFLDPSVNLIGGLDASAY